VGETNINRHFAIAMGKVQGMSWGQSINLLDQQAEEQSKPPRKT